MKGLRLGREGSQPMSVLGMPCGENSGRSDVVAKIGSRVESLGWFPRMETGLGPAKGWRRS